MSDKIAAHQADSTPRTSNSSQRMDSQLAETIGSVDNAPTLCMKHDQLTIDGYSRAAVQTYWRIAELKLGF
ncbi:MAG TPA: hypothetical protein VM260_12275, partial [Pirellula sp.]|nr:hypothetical protein [Pirellula sp.]